MIISDKVCVTGLGGGEEIAPHYIDHALVRHYDWLVLKSLYITDAFCNASNYSKRTSYFKCISCSDSIEPLNT